MLKNLNPIKWRKTTRILWLSFLLPSLIMLVYFAYRKMAPFGSSSILTVDLGQQYIDFFAGYKTTLTGNLNSIFFNFAKGLGGESLGDWAYYLMSPTNLVLLFFPNASLPAGILFLTVIKYGLASWSMAFALKRMRWQRGWSLLFFGVIYSMSGWFVANQLNLLWLDAAILLPFIVVGLEKYLNECSKWQYILPLTAMLIINYYMAYMVGLFMILYFIWRQSWSSFAWQSRLRMLRKFVFGSAVSIGLSAFIWLPTAYTLMNSKGQYMLENLKWNFEYPIADFIGKFFLGTFNFDQMPTGLPNIFVGSLVLITVWYFFTSQQIRWQTRLWAAIITSFLILSMMYAPLDLAWHGFQYPVWYPYRFSFVFSFWLIWLAASIWSPKLQMNWWQLGFLLVILVVSLIYLFSRLNKLNFLTQDQLILGVTFFALMLILYILANNSRWWLAAVSLLAIGEMTVSTIWTLNQFSYLTNTEYQTYIRALQKVSRNFKPNHHTFYRVAQSFQRTKGDPLQGNYFGASTFSSALEHQQSDFMAAIGQPEGDNYVTYNSGTLLTDDLLGMRYLMQPTGNQAEQKGTPSNMATFPRWDTNGIYKIQQTTSDVVVSKNENALPLVFAASPNALNLRFKADDPLTNQNRLWDTLTGYNDNQVFTAVNFNQTSVDNLNAPGTITGAFLKKNNDDQPASISMTYTPKTDSPYYLSIGGQISADEASITVNGTPIAAIPSHRHTIVLALPAGVAGQPQNITFTLNKNELWLQNVSLYQSDQTAIAQGAEQLKANGITNMTFADTKITGDINLPANQNLVMTTIPYAKGWQIKIDGHVVTNNKVGGFFLAATTTPGKHHIELTFEAPYLKAGIIISAGTLLFTLGVLWTESFNQRHKKIY
ncbi:YfhO family protein [Weissella oryzae]|uniref:YfhO family protein n=1 Tax=Weissella oryzae TaxID=1129792 RepID=UPI000485A388|nr:YfhO family protein [Weissella oryzae]